MAKTRAEVYKEQIALKQAMMSKDKSSSDDSVVSVSESQPVSEPDTESVVSEPIEALTKLSEAISGASDDIERDDESVVLEESDEEFSSSRKASREDDSDDERVVDTAGTDNGTEAEISVLSESTESEDVAVPKKKQVKTRASKAKGDMRPAQIRDFPRSLLDMCKAYFPGATATEALAAYVLMKSGEISSDIPEEIIALAKAGDDGDTLQSLDDRVGRIEKKFDTVISLLEATLMASTFTVFDLVGFRQEAAKSPRDINYLENGMDDAIERLKSQAKLQHSRDAASEGRPKKGASRGKASR